MTRVSKLFCATVALAALLPAQLVAQSKITTTGRLYPPAAKQDQEASPAAETNQSEQSENVDENSATDEFQATDTLPIEEAVEPELAATEHDDSNELNLICAGGGSANKASVGTVNAFNSYGGYASATVVGQRSQGFADEVRVRINDDDPRLRMPRSMLPSLRGGKGGWFKLKNVKFKEGEITASVAVNIVNNPKLRVDRYTGAISISGKAGDYSGQCQRFDPKKMQRAF